jgi:hypothetical protein
VRLSGRSHHRRERICGGHDQSSLRSARLRGTPQVYLIARYFENFGKHTAIGAAGATKDQSGIWLCSRIRTARSGENSVSARGRTRIG